MAIEETFERLVGAFAAAEEVFQGLHLTVIEDRPAHGEVLLVERLGNLVEDMRGWLAEGQTAAVDSRRAVAHRQLHLATPPVDCSVAATICACKKQHILPPRRYRQ